VMESSTLAVDASELELSAGDNASLATSGADESAWLASSVDVSGSCRLQVPIPASAVAEHSRSTDVDDSSEDEESTWHLLCLLLIDV